MGWQVAHGNEDTFREMLRIRRSVAASFSQTHFNTANITVPDAAGPSTGAQLVARSQRMHYMANLACSVSPTLGLFLTRVRNSFRCSICALHEFQATINHPCAAVRQPRWRRGPRKWPSAGAATTWPRWRRPRTRPAARACPAL